MPDITADDLLEDAPPPVTVAPPVMRFSSAAPAPAHHVSFKPTMLDDDLPSLIPDGAEQPMTATGQMSLSQSWSIDFMFRDPEPGWSDFTRSIDTDEDLRRMRKSQSAPFGDGWSDMFGLF
jgi:hypothetical protein